jgi:hypothetical protein
MGRSRQKHQPEALVLSAQEDREMAPVEASILRDLDRLLAIEIGLFHRHSHPDPP